jgi:hypothetical protein
MSTDDAEAIESQYAYWDAKHAKQDFLHRMERKLGRKERLNQR